MSTFYDNPPSYPNVAKILGHIDRKGSVLKKRPTVDEILMAEAWLWSIRGTCSRRQVGAVIATTEGRTLSHGYNGALSGMPHCKPHNDYQPCDTSEHAERNAFYAAAKKGVSLDGCMMFSTDSPCVGCARGVVQTGIKRFVYARHYREFEGVALLRAAGVETVQMQLSRDVLDSLRELLVGEK